MANDTTPENKDVNSETNEDENVNIEGIEGLEKDVHDDAGGEKKEEVLFTDGPKLSDKLQEMEDSIVKEKEEEAEKQAQEKKEEAINAKAQAANAQQQEEEDGHDAGVEILEHDHDDEEESQENKSKVSLVSKLKDKKNLLKVLIGVLALLVLIITLLFLFLPSDEQEVNTKPQQTPKEELNTVAPTEVQAVQKPQYDFKLDHINITRINEKLQTLTKYELLGITEEEYYRQQKLKAEQKAKEMAELKEKLRLEKEKKEQLAKEEAALQEKLRLEKEKKEQLAKEAAQKEAQLMAQKEQAKEDENRSNEKSDSSNSDKQNDEKSSTQEQKSQKSNNTSNTFLKFVHVPTYKKTLYKTELTKIKDIDARIHPCRNKKNLIEIFVGPLDSQAQYTQIVNALKQKVNYENIKMLELTQEEFEKRCMVY